jgi:transcription factor E2F6
MKRKRSITKKNKAKCESSSLSSSESIKDDNTLECNNKSKIKRPRQRQENSLGELTKNFIKYIKERGENIVHINDVVKKLKVKKRRIYDITNVLEGM